MSYDNRGRRSYKKLMQETVWGVFDEDGNLQGTCKAAGREAAYAVFQWHNQRNPKWAIHGELREVK